MEFTLFFILIGFLILKNVVRIYLAFLNNRLLKSFQYSQLPEPVQKIFTPEKFSQMVEYNLEKSHFNNYAALAEMSLLIIVCYPPLPNYIYHFFGKVWWQQALFLVLCTVVGSIWGSCVDFISQFTIEEKYGFNKSSKGLWFRDFIMGLILSIVFQSILFGVLLYLVDISQYWWLISFFFVFGFGIFMMIISPYVIQPLFNKFSDLPEGALKDELVQLAKQTGFSNKGIYVMDGSKRSKHSNAYFSGFGKFRRIVLFDTLVEQLSIEELKAVLAHEIGHYKKAHILKSMMLPVVFVLGAFWLLAFLQKQTWVYAQLGFNESYVGSVAPLLFFLLFFGDSILYFISPIISRISRKFEYEADAYARDVVGSGEPLVNALSKLTTENMGNPLPHPIFSGFYYSHPTFIERRSALLNTSRKETK